LANGKVNRHFKSANHRNLIAKNKPGGPWLKRISLEFNLNSNTKFSQ